MNPPFSATGGRVAPHRSIYGAKQIESALRRLEEGGRLVSIVGDGMSFHHPSFAEWWQRIARLYKVRANFHLNGKEYAKYGTTFDVQILIIDKTGATPGDNWQAQLSHINWGEADTIEQAWDALNHLTAHPLTPAPEPEADDTEPESAALFVPYVCAKLKGGKPHPAQIVESASMAAVVPPDITYRPQLAPEIVTRGLLSDIQLERVIYAGQRHEQRLADGSRAGFFIGDGTGLGKGRILNKDGIEEIRKEDEYNVPRFLNRVLALCVDEQNALFDFFANLFDQTVSYAKANGTFDAGITDIKALAIRLAKQPRIVHIDQITGAETTHYTLEVDQPTDAVSFEQAEQVRQRNKGAFFEHRKKGHFILAIMSRRHTDPNTGASYQTYAI